METIYDAGRRVFEAARWDTLQVGNTDDCIEMFEAGVEFAQRWISVEDELPEESDFVLVKTGSGCITTAYFHQEDSYFTSGIITHWRPIELK